MVSKLIKQFLTNDFYHKNKGSYNNHNSSGFSYSGYWSFESAAFVKIRGLDDSSFVKHRYYSKDLVHSNPESSKKKDF